MRAAGTHRDGVVAVALVYERLVLNVAFEERVLPREQEVHQVYVRRRHPGHASRRLSASSTLYARTVDELAHYAPMKDEGNAAQSTQRTVARRAHGENTMRLDALQHASPD